MQNMSLIEYFWRASQQIVMLNPNEPLDKAGIEAWGSGFLLEYRESLYFITCDHNLHLLDDYSNGERANLDFNVAIITNDRNQATPLSMGLVFVPEFYYFDSFDTFLPEIMDMKDVAFAKIKQDFPLSLLTNQLTYPNGSIAVKEGLEKLYITEDAIAEPNAEKDFVITGCIRNHIVDDIRMDRGTTFREGIKYDANKLNINKQFVFINPEPIIYEDWKGLSGSPIFDQDGKLVGMVNGVNEGGYDIYVTPIHFITKLIDYTIAAEIVHGKN